MLDPTALFRWSSDVTDPNAHGFFDDDATLVITLGGAMDAGSTRKFLEERIIDGFSNHKIATFDTDQLYDYSGKRPTIIFDRDHFQDYERPEIALYEVSDINGKRFILLAGPEPSLQWERMSAAVGHIVDVLDISRVVFLQSVPSPTPHTRPIYVSGFANKPGLLGIHEGLPAAFQMGASFTSMLALRLSDLDVDVLGLFAHIPHYLAEMDYPDGAITLLDRIGTVSDLELPSGGDLAQSSMIARQLIDQNISRSEGVTETLSKLEEQYENFMEQRALNSHADIPSADEIGAEFEEYLRTLDNPGDSATDGNPLG